MHGASRGEGRAWPGLGRQRGRGRGVLEVEVGKGYYEREGGWKGQRQGQGRLSGDKEGRVKLKDLRNNEEDKKIRFLKDKGRR